MSLKPNCQNIENKIYRSGSIGRNPPNPPVFHALPPQVTHNQMNVLDLSWLEEGAELGPEELQPLSRTMAASLQQLIEQRDKAAEVRGEGVTGYWWSGLPSPPNLLRCLFSSILCTDFPWIRYFQSVDQQQTEQENRHGVGSGGSKLESRDVDWKMKFTEFLVAIRLKQTQMTKTSLCKKKLQVLTLSYLLYFM